MRKRTFVVGVCSVFMGFFVAFFAESAFAAIPLITDDTGTQGKGKFQLELFGEYGHDKETLLRTKTATFRRH